MRAPFSRPDGVSNSGEMSVILSTPKSLAKNTAIRTVAGDFALGDQEADRRFLVDMLLDLRRQRELANGRRRFEIERREVDRLARAVLDHLDDAGERLALGQIASPRFVHVGAEGVVQLQSVDAQMDMRRAEAGRVDKPGQRRDGALHLRRLDGIDQIVEQRLQRLDRQQIVAVGLGDDVGGFRKASLDRS